MQNPVRSAFPARRSTLDARRSTSAFTLVELLVTIGIMAVVLGLLLQPMISGFRLMRKGADRADTQQAARRALTEMSNELSNAMDIIRTGGSIAFVLPDMRTFCTNKAGDPDHYDKQVSDNYVETCPYCHTASVRHEIKTPLAPMRYDFGNGELVPAAVVYWSTGKYVARGIVPLSAAGSNSNPPAQDAFPLTPVGGDYSISGLSFRPTRVEAETLTPMRQEGVTTPTVYRARYPVWEQDYRVVVWRWLEASPGQWEWRCADDSTPGWTSDPVVPSPTLEVHPYEGEVWFGDISHRLTASAPGPEIKLFGGTDMRLVVGSEIVRLLDRSTNQLGPPLSRRDILRGDERPDSARPLQEGEYDINYDRGVVYVKSPVWDWLGQAKHYQVSYQRMPGHDPNDVVLASYTTKALITIDLTVRKEDTATGKAGPEGILAQYQDFHLVTKVKIRNLVR